MKNIKLLAITLLSLLSITSIAQNIPVENGKVVFSDTIQTNLNKEKTQKKLLHWLDESFLKNKGFITLNDTVNNMIVCSAMEYLEVEKSSWNMFALYMRYKLIFEIKENQCIVFIRNINYFEPEDIEGDNKKTVSTYPGEFILIEKKYKSAFKKNISEKISAKTVERVNEIWKTIENELK